MKLLALGATGALASAAAGAVALLLLLPALAVGAPHPTAAPSTTAATDIPADLLPVYLQAAASCGMPWPVLAAVGKIEGDHGRSTAPGVHAGTNDAGAAGPMQFLAGTWSTYGVDADDDGTADIYSPVDSIWGAARYLCANGAADPARLRDALHQYNHDDTYVDTVLRTAAGYQSTVQAARTGRHALPLPMDLLTAAAVAAPHHDYPAIDIAAPVGTPAFAIVDGTVIAAAFAAGDCGGTVVLRGDDDTRVTYCHASQLLVEPGQQVDAGDPVLLTGGQPGQRGAGDASGPHLHLGVTAGGLPRCPQSLLADWLQGIDADPTTAPAFGCTR